MREYVEQIKRQSNSVSRFTSTLKLRGLACGARQWRENSEILQITEADACALKEWDWSLPRREFGVRYELRA